MADTFTRVDLETLLKAGSNHCLSLYMPTVKAGPEIRQNPTRFKNLLAEAEALFSQRGVSADLSDQILAPLRELVPNNVFWANMSTGLAILGEPESFRMYRLPMECPEIVQLADHFHLKPLIGFLKSDLNFYLLALSQNQTRLLQCSKQRVIEMDPPNMPRSLDEALKYDDPHYQLQFHTGAPGRGRERPAMFHGQGVGIDESKDNILRYSYHVNKSLESILRDEKSPLILATVDYLFPIYRTANSYPHLLEHFVKGNPEEISAEDLRDQAWPFVEKLGREEEEKAVSAFEEKAGTGFTSTNLKDVIPSSLHGRVDFIIVAADSHEWGFVDEEKGQVVLHENRRQESYELLNFASIQTLLHGGSVYVLPQERIPGKSIAAVYRY